MCRRTEASPINPGNFNGGRRAMKISGADGKEEDLMLLVILLIVLLLALAPTWPYSRRWGYYPSGALGAVLLVVIVFVLLGRFRL